MSSFRRLRLYASQFDRAVLGLTIDLGADGTVLFTPGVDETASSFLMRLVGRGVSIRAEPFFVTPDAGAAYVDAVAAMLSRTSRWLVVAE